MGVFLLTASAREYRVVMEPGEERLLGCGHTCQHPDTNTSFSLGEECTQWADNFTQVDIPLRFISQRFFRVELGVWCLVADSDISWCPCLNTRPPILLGRIAER